MSRTDNREHESLSQTLRMWAIYTSAALLVLLPLLGRGYILTLDLVFTPRLRMPASVTSSYLLHVLFHVLNYVLPSDVIEKIVLFLILLLSGVGMHRLARQLYGGTSDIYQKIGAYFAGIFYMINPFTYDRFMAGQYDVLLGYALLPWFAGALLIFVKTPTVRQSINLAVWAVTIGIVSIHTLGMAALLAIITVCLAAWRKHGQGDYLRRLLRLGLLSAAIFLATSSYWLVPLALGHGNTATAISSFGANDQSAFTTLGGSPVGKIGNVLRLQGFWAEARNMYSLPQDAVPAWGLLALIIWVLVAAGIVSFWRAEKRDTVLLFGGSAAVALILAIGTFNGWLTAHIPFFAGYREPEKFVALIALGFAVFAARGVAATLQYFHEQGGKFFLILAGVLLILVPVVWTPAMWWGCNNQLAPAQYPADWFVMNQRLGRDHSNFQTLFLPWHLYMYFGFAGRIIANPAPNFFDKPIVVSDNPEFRGTALAGSTPAKRQLDHILPTANGGNTLGRRLAPLNIKYILLAKDNDYQQYTYLNRQTDLRLVGMSATLELYRNEAWGK